ncbi:MAG: alpha-L-fucosidase, partial [Muribaculaceae bacterium]|nr:alpha-L-fucosidase [Muribaculaceae bacterium]
MRLINSLAIAAIALTGCSKSDTMPYRNSIAVSPEMSRSELAEAAAHVVPTPNQLTALDDGFIGFFHFGPNTFTSREWGTGYEDPKIFNPTNLNTDQWVKAMKDAGMKKVILTAKHHDGFVLWNSRYTDHGVMSSPWRDGKGDIMRDLSESCKKYGMKLGIYLSPADLYQIESPDGLYGNLSQKTQRVIPRQVEGRPFESDVTFTFEGIDDYNEYFLNQLYELLTEYGPIDEVWLDGAHPKRKGGQTYNYPAWRTLVRTLAPNAVIFGREDLRWVGNEGGQTRYAERNVVGYEFDPDTVTVFPDLLDQDLGSLDMLSQANFLHY